MDKTSLLYINNGTPQVIDIASPSPVAEGVIIIICYLFGIGYNLIIIVAVLHSSELRASSFYVMLLEVCVTCLLDCLTNESIAFGFLLNSGTTWCGFSAAVFHFFLLTHSSSLGLLLLERALSPKDRLITVRVALSGVLVSWLFGLVFVSPMFGVFEVHNFPYRNACSAAKTNLWFSVFSLLGFLLLWGIMAIGVFDLVCCIKKYLSDRKQLDIPSIFSSSNEIQNPVLPITLCSKNRTAYTVVFLYTILIIPMTISFSVTLFLTPILEPNPWIDPRIPTNQTRSLLTNLLEPLFVYSRYMYNALVPIVILSTDRDIRLQSRQVFCSRGNVISIFDQNLISSHNSDQLRTLPTDSLCSLRTPVLFATSRGLHLRTILSNQTRYRESVSDSKSKLKLMTAFCDVTINSTNVERSTYDFSQTVKVGEEYSRNKRYVRFSSQVDAISAPESRLSVWSSADNASQSNTRTITTPLFVKGES